MTPAKTNTTDPAALSSQVDALLADLLVVRRHQASDGPSIPSSTGIALDNARVGVTGDGCSVHVPREMERVQRVAPKPLEYIKLWHSGLDASPYHTLRVLLAYDPSVLNLELRRFAPIRLAPTPAVEGVARHREKLEHEIDIREWAAWMTNGDPQKRTQWERGLRSGDSRAARDAMRTAGAARLNACAEEWCR